MSGLDAFAQEHLPMVQRVAASLRSELRLQADLADDLVGYGHVGLLEARERFDPSREEPFEKFAYLRIRGAMLDGVRKMKALPRRAYEAVQREAAVQAALEHVEEKESVDPTRPDFDSYAAALGDTLGRLATSLTVSAIANEQHKSPEEQVLGQLEQVRVRKTVEGLPPREQKVVHALYYAERRLDDVGADLGISKSVASRIHSSALDRLKKRLTP